MDTDKGYSSLKVALIFIYGHIALGNGNRETGTCHHIFGIFGDKRGTVVTRTIGDFYYFLGLKSLQADPCNTRGVVPVYKDPSSIELPLGLRDIRVVGIVPRNKTKGGLQHWLGFLGISITIGREL